MVIENSSKIKLVFVTMGRQTDRRFRTINNRNFSILKKNRTRADFLKAARNLYILKPTSQN
jgi:hypothetical protein